MPSITATIVAIRRGLSGLLVLALAGGVLLSGHGQSPSRVFGLELVAPAQAAPDTEARVRFFEARIRRDPFDFLALNRVAGAYLQRARENADVTDYDRAEAALKRSLEALPEDNAAALLALGSVQLARHRFSDALASAERVRRLRPGDPAVAALAGDAFIGLGRYDEADEAYERLAAGSPGPAALGRLAHVRELRGDTDGALWLLSEALLSQATNAETMAWLYVQRGHLLLQAGSPERAEEDYQRALTALPGYIHALAGVARARVSQGDDESAIAIYQRVVQRTPLLEYVTAYGDVLWAVGRTEEAGQQYGLVGAIAQLYQASGVETDLQMVLFAADHGGDLAAWVPRARALVERQPTIYASDALAWTLYRAGDYAAASEAMASALRLGTRDPGLLFHAGMIARSRGEHASAIGYLEKALAPNQRFSPLLAGEARRALAELKGEASSPAPAERGSR
ncbi:MAG: tetratricopeptide repeat protein [Chloroflexi bacterium]|nr:tetratricopeptide repeat protein [Chloroflexota bacterium]